MTLNVNADSMSMSFMPPAAKPRTLNSGPMTLNSGVRIQDPRPRIANPKPKILDPQDSTPRTQDPGSWSDQVGSGRVRVGPTCQMGPIFDPSAMDLGPTSWLIVVDLGCYHTYATPSLPALIPSSRKGAKQVDKEERGEKVVGMVVQ